MWSSEWQTVNNQYPLAFGLLRLLTFVPCFPFHHDRYHPCLCVCGLIRVVFVAYASRAATASTNMPRYLFNRSCRPVCRPYVMAGSSLANAGPSDRNRPLQRPTCKRGVSAPSRTRYSYFVNLQRAERLRGPARMSVDYLLVIVTHSCRSYLPITSIASQNPLTLTKGAFHQSLLRDILFTITARIE